MKIRLKKPGSRLPLNMQPVIHFPDTEMRALILVDAIKRSEVGTLHCEDCGVVHAFDTTYLSTSRYYLRDNKSVVKIFEDTVYCVDCSEISRAENILVAYAERMLDKQEALQEGRKAIVDRYENASWLTRLLQSWPRYNQAMVDLRQGAREICQSLDRLDILENRTTPRRCLECGSTRLKDFKKPFAPMAGASKDAYATHPNCGGLLYTDPSTTAHFIISGERTVKYYSLDGKFIEEGRQPEWDSTSYWFVPL